MLITGACPDRYRVTGRPSYRSPGPDRCAGHLCRPPGASSALTRSPGEGRPASRQRANGAITGTPAAYLTGPRRPEYAGRHQGAPRSRLLHRKERSMSNELLMIMTSNGTLGDCGGPTGVWVEEVC